MIPLLNTHTTPLLSTHTIPLLNTHTTPLLNTHMAFIKYKMLYNNGAPITKANIKPLIISLTSVPSV
jgi:hypothetical protein